MFKKRGLSEVIGLVLILGITIVISFVIYFYFRSIDIIPSETCPDEVSIRLDEARYVERTKYNYPGFTQVDLDNNHIADDTDGDGNPGPGYVLYSVPVYDPPVQEYFDAIYITKLVNHPIKFSKVNTETITLNITNIGFYSIKGVYARIKVDNNAKEETIALFNTTGGTELLFDNGLDPGESEKIKVLKDRVDKTELKKWEYNGNLINTNEEWWDYDIESLVVIPIVNIEDDEKTKSVACKDASLKTQNLLKLRRADRKDGGLGFEYYQRTPFESCTNVGLSFSNPPKGDNLTILNYNIDQLISNSLNKNNGDCKEKDEKVVNNKRYSDYDLFRVAKNNSFSCIEGNKFYSYPPYGIDYYYSNWYTDSQLFCLNGYFYEVYPNNIDPNTKDNIWTFRNLYYGNPADETSEDKVAEVTPGTRIGDFMADPDYEDGYFYQVVRN